MELLLWHRLFLTFCFYVSSESKEDTADWSIARMCEDAQDVRTELERSAQGEPRQCQDALLPPQNRRAPEQCWRRRAALSRRQAIAITANRQPAVPVGTVRPPTIRESEDVQACTDGRV